LLSDRANGSFCKVLTMICKMRRVSYAKSFPYLTSRVSAELRTNIAEVRHHQLFTPRNVRKSFIRFEIDSIKGVMYTVA
jgi:hypothetical protein